MNVKCIAIGNPIMGDDSIGIKVLEQLSEDLIKDNVEVIIGETDIDYTLMQIKDGDFIFILDSTYFGVAPGTVSITTIEKASKYKRNILSQHEPSLIHLLHVYGKQVKGYLIGIEIEKIDYDVELSPLLRNNFSEINEEVYKLITDRIQKIILK